MRATGQFSGGAAGPSAPMFPPQQQVFINLKFITLLIYRREKLLVRPKFIYILRIICILYRPLL